MQILSGELDFWIDKITRREPFTFIRLGDGELLCAQSKKGRNLSGHTFTKKLAADIRQTMQLKPSERLFFGLGGRSRRLIGARKIAQLAGGQAHHWIDFEPIYAAVIDFQLTPFIEAIKARDLVVVGPPYFEESFAAAVAPVAAHVVVPNRQCYSEFDRIRAQTLAACERLETPLVLASCSLPSVPLGREVFLHGGDSTSFFDAGSIWEPLLGTEEQHPRSWYAKRKKKRAPYLEDAVVDRIKKLLSVDKVCLEWGLGGSTLEFAPLACKWHTIEHDKDWFDDITTRLKAHGLEAKTFPVLVPCPQAKWQRARDRRNKCRHWPSSWQDLDRTSSTGGYRPYITAATQLADKTFDLILVDGRARPECVKAVYDHRLLAPGGRLLVHDWFNRKPRRTHYNLLLQKYDVVEMVESLAILAEKPRTETETQDGPAASKSPRKTRARRPRRRRRRRGVRLETERKDAVVVTLHQHHERFGRPCIESLERHAHPSCEIIVYDNSSMPPFHETHPYLAARVRYIYIEDQMRHGGLTGTWNAGILYAEELGCDRVCLLNHDTVVYDDFPHLLAQCCVDSTVFGPISNKPGYGGGRYQRGRKKDPFRRHAGRLARVPSINGFCMAAHLVAWQKSAWNWQQGLVFRPDFPFGGNETEFLRRHTARGGNCAVVHATYVQHFKNRAWRNLPAADDALLQKKRA